MPVSKLKVRIPEGARVRDPETRQVLAEGEHEVASNAFWHRRVRDGSVEIVPTTSSPVLSPRRARSIEGEK